MTVAFRVPRQVSGREEKEKEQEREGGKERESMRR